MVRQRAACVPSDGRPAVGRAAGADRSEVVPGRGQRAAAGRLVRAVARGKRVRAVRVVRGAGPEHGPERGARADVRGRDGRAPAQGPAVVRVHVHHHAGLVRRVPHVHRDALAHRGHDQHGRAHRVVRGRRTPGKRKILFIYTG